MYQKNVKKNHFDLLLISEKGKRHYVLTFFLKNLIYSFVIIFYVVQQYIFVVVAYKLLLQKKY